MLEAERTGVSARRVAFFGGSFDPPHLGHVAVARAARSALDLDMVLFAPVGAQPLKTQTSTAGFEDRVEMTRLAIAAEAGFELSLVDAPKSSGEPNYTLETLQSLRAELGEDGLLFCLVGADSFFGLRKWHRGVDIPFVAPLIVAARPGQKLDEIKTALPPGLAMDDRPMRQETRNGVEVRSFLLTDQAGDPAALYLLPGLDIAISASEIRDGVRSGDAAAGTDLLPPAVADYVRTHGLYR
jgi:nicotinate-nucleotide adenylyltransferase